MSDVNSGLERPRVVEVTETVQEGPGLGRVFLDGSVEFEPGQFGMVWIPGVDEIPLSFVGGDPLEFLVHDVGEATSTMLSLEVGDRLGVRGPYGSSFDTGKGDSLLVGGGVGVAPLLALGRGLDRFDAAVGAQTEEFLVGAEELGAEVSTDDGSRGFHGFVTEMVEEEFSLESYDVVYCCGPEVMMRAVLDLCIEADVEVQFSLERYMKCGIGICGSCCIDPTGERVCVEGPVFRGEELVGTEFGEYCRSGTGRKREI